MTLTMVKSGCAAPTFLQGGGRVGALLRDVNWSLHRLGPPETWHPSLKACVGIVLGAQQPMLVCWGSDLHAIYNDAFAVLCGDRHPAGLGQPVADLWHDRWNGFGPAIDRVRRGDSSQTDEMAFLVNRSDHPEYVHSSISFNPVLGNDGNVLGMFCTCADVSDRVSLRRELEHERLTLGHIFEQAPNFIAKLEGPDHIVTLANRACFRLVGDREILGKPVAQALPEVAGQGYLELLDTVMKTAQAVRIDAGIVDLRRGADGNSQVSFVDVMFHPIVDATGSVTGVFVDGVDVTRREEATLALRHSEQFLRSVLAASSDCVKVLTMTGELMYMNDGGREIMEVPEGTVLLGCPWLDFWKEAGRADALRAIAEAQDGRSCSFQGFAETFAGNPRFWDVRVTPMLNQDGVPEKILTISRDISYLKRVEQDRDHLTQELAHRLKNAFSMVQSVISQTLRKANSLSEGREVLAGRIQALAAAQNILTGSSTSEMNLTEVVKAALLPHRSGEGRFHISGKEAVVTGRQGLGLSLALHELATNATKYGALSNTDGQVAVAWEIAPDGGFTFSWIESDGPPVVPPEQTGFGSLLIEKVVATYFDGAAQLDFDADGLQFRLTGVIPPKPRSSGG